MKALIGLFKIMVLAEMRNFGKRLKKCFKKIGTIFEIEISAFTNNFFN